MEGNNEEQNKKNDNENVNDGSEGKGKEPKARKRPLQVGIVLRIAKSPSKKKKLEEIFPLPSQAENGESSGNNEEQPVDENANNGVIGNVEVIGDEGEVAEEEEAYKGLVPLEANPDEEDEDEEVPDETDSEATDEAEVVEPPDNDNEIVVNENDQPAGPLPPPVHPQQPPPARPLNAAERRRRWIRAFLSRVQHYDPPLDPEYIPLHDPIAEEVRCKLRRIAFLHHTVHCFTDNCDNRRHCRPLKYVLLHHRFHYSRQPRERGCLMCERLVAICRDHAVRCFERLWCPMPHCFTIRRLLGTAPNWGIPQRAEHNRQDDEPAENGPDLMQRVALHIENDPNSPPPREPSPFEDEGQLPYAWGP